MKTFRNVVIALGLLLLLYFGAYGLFARKEMRRGYETWGSIYPYSLESRDWRKLFVPLASLDYRMNVERPAWKKSIGHWESEDSADFVTLARNGQCSFRIGKFEHSGKVDRSSLGIYDMEFTRDGRFFEFSFVLSEFAPGGGVSGKADATVWMRALDPIARHFGGDLIQADATLTRTDSPD